MASKTVSAAAMHGNMASPETGLQDAFEWTTEDFAAAVPFPAPEITQEMVAEFLAKTAGPSAKGGSTSPGGAPSDAHVDDGSDDAVTGYPYPPPRNEHEVLVSYTTYPYSTIGKVFFFQNGIRYQASAAAIGKNGIWTAGHCVHMGNNLASGWSTNMVFIPAFKDNAAPLGQFSVRQLFCRTAWYQHGNPGGLYEDMGAAILNPLNGRTVAQTVGWLGFAWNFPRNQIWTSLGYPAAPPFNGLRMWQDTAPYANDGSVPGSPQPEGIGCSMTGGCSGGPWVMGLGSANHINGHNSYRPNSQPLEIYSPYFGDNAHSLMQLVTA